MGVLCAAVGRRIDTALRGGGVARDYFALAWYALAAFGFLFAAFAGLVRGGATDLVLLATLRLGLVLAFVLALAALTAAGGHLFASWRGRVRASPHPQG